MTEHDAALRFDQALDGTYRHELNGAEPLVETARTVQSLFDGQHAIPSEEFVMQLERSLFSPASVIPSAVEGPPAAAVSRPIPLPRPARTPLDTHRLSRSRLAAIAAVLALLIGGMGAFVFGPWGNGSKPEPSAIPAALLGTVEASPAAKVANWTVAPPQGSTRVITPGLVSNGRIFTVFAADGDSTIVQVVDQQTGKVLWSGSLGSWQNLLVSTAGELLLATETNGNQNLLTAYDESTGDVRWQFELEQRPVGLLVQDDRILVLGSGNGLDAFDLNSQQSLWQADLSQYDEAAADDAGMNKYFNMTGSRLAATDGVVGAIVSNGRLVGVDIDDGAVRWANERTTNSATLVAVVDSKFVVTAPGSDMQGYDYDGAAGTPIPETDQCQAAIAPRTGSTPGSIRPNGAGADSIDPATGESPWGVESNRPAWIWPLDESNLIAVVSPGWDIVNDQPQNMFPCKIDGATGAISDLDGSSLADVVLDINSESLTGMASFPDGGSFAITDIDPTVAASLPLVETDGSNAGGVSWLQTVDGVTLVVLTDGTLIGLPENGPSWASEMAATPEPGEVIWTTSGPEGAGNEWHEPAFADGRVFRSFKNLVTEDHVQAVDTETGAELWQKEIDISTSAMMVGGDFLLIAGQDKSVMGSSSLVLALDPATGDEVWRSSSDQSAVSMAVTDDRVLVLGSNNQLDAFDLLTGEAIYSSDLTGNSRPSSEVISLPDGMVEMGLTVVGDTVVAVLADTSLAGVNIETGAGLWWRIRDVVGSVFVYSVDGSLVVIDAGDMEAIIEYQSSFGIPSSDATPVVTQDFERAPCIDSGVSATPLVDEDGEPFLPVPKEALGLDPLTGDGRWTLESSYLSSPLIASDAELFYLATVREAWPMFPAQSTVCALDPVSGEVSQVDSLDPVAEATFVAALASTPDILLRANVINGELVMRLDALNPATTEPDIVIDDVTDGAIRWIEVYDGALYIASENADLKRVQLPDA